ncbi:TlpA disulfide reductase family protein [Sphingobacterium gobiense]|uniref:Thioredoxin domain-containing protein n=1 Tax=Sphingobacterium gobiense TaxID=1382456 RepID=A0A2S9JGG3_9SPHI|nr:TlpA disulfide reductase family protein [Sphingobacterium gobiense]PRD52008.1 hypothetical protein C5749_17065 [Sphingobacterium gobiense]
MNKIKLLAVMMTVSGAVMAQKAEITGNITGLEDGQIVFTRLVDGEYKQDSVETAGGNFTWSADLKTPQKIGMMFPSRYFSFFAAGNEQIKIAGTADSLWALKVSGSKLQDEAVAYEKNLQDLTDQEMPLYQKWGKGTEEEQRELEEKIGELRRQKRERARAYIVAHPNSYFSLDLVNERAMMGAYEDIKPVFDLLSAEKRNTEVGQALVKRLDVLKRSAIGEPMLNFTQNDQNGNPVIFEDFKGKYVLVDFWASWCGPCRAENPNVLKEYNLYKDKNFTVLGVSLDDNADRWKKAIEEDKMPWTQVSDLKGFKNEVSTYYGIMGIPSTLLVDPSGKIIAKDLRGEMLAKKLDELFN